nr:hypothetical protein [Candidatus Njordarchaeota archaeon]
MNELLERLTGGNLASEGRTNEVAEDVIRDPSLLPKLVEWLSESDDLIRARTAHAFERISRTSPDLLHPLASQFIKLALTEKVPMVKWHLAITFGNAKFPEKESDIVLVAFFHLLEDESVFVKSWAMVSLVFWGRRIRSKRREIAARIKAFQDDRCTAIRTRVAEALRVLENDNEPIPSGWIKTGNPKRL